MNRKSVNSIAVLSATAFAGCNLFIGLSMGIYWLSLSPSIFYHEFWPQFLHFVLTIIPLFLIMPVALVLSARIDWHKPDLRRIWLITLFFYVVVTAITSIIHLPLNLQMGAATYSSDAAARNEWYWLINIFGQADMLDASSNRSYWLLWHVPRIALTLLIAYFALKASLSAPYESNKDHH
ncbi:MAG: hypothetical protein AAF542_21075 [Pseudomonadota bacterium]